MMSDLPAIDSMWEYNDLPGTETRFREVLSRPDIIAHPLYEWELKTQLARTFSLRYQFSEAHAVLDEVATHREEFSPLVEVRYLLERGRTYNSASQKDKAVPLFLEALELAESKANLIYYAADAAHMLAIATPPEEQITWHQKTETLIKSSNDARALKWLGPLYNNLGWTLHDLGRYEEALEVFQQGVAYREREGNPVSIRIAKWTVGRTLRSLEQYDEALVIQQKLWAELQTAGEEDGYVAEELGEILLALNRPEEARHYFAHAHALLASDKWLQEHEPGRLKRLKELSGNM